MAHEVGYARVSKRDQNPDAQEAELRAAGCERVFVDHGESSRSTDRPQWLECLNYLRAGDILKVRRLDRLAGSERILIETLQDLDARQVNLVSLTEPMIEGVTDTLMKNAEFAGLSFEEYVEEIAREWSERDFRGLGAIPPAGATTADSSLSRSSIPAGSSTSSTPIPSPPSRARSGRCSRASTSHT